jgi:hypothetical protein
MARDFVTSRPSACGEKFMLCRNKTLSNGLVKTKERANRHPHKPANLSAKKWNTSVKGNMALARRSRPLPLACRRRGVPVWNCPHRGAPGNERKDRLDAISPGAGAPRSGHRVRVRARPHARCAAKAARPRPGGVCPATPRKSRADADLLRALAPPKKPPGREREDASCTVRWPERISAKLGRARWCADNSAGYRTSAPSNFHLQNGPVRLYCTLRSEFLN